MQSKTIASIGDRNRENMFPKAYVIGSELISMMDRE